MSDCPKRTYATREAAVFFARSDGTRAYFCPKCKAFHLTSMPREGKRMGVAKP